MQEHLWVEKYRPTTIEECILPSQLKKDFKQILKQKEEYVQAKARSQAAEDVFINTVRFSFNVTCAYVKNVFDSNTATTR